LKFLTVFFYRFSETSAIKKEGEILQGPEAASFLQAQSSTHQATFSEDPLLKGVCAFDFNRGENRAGMGRGRMV